jgi:hypothetical protein
MAAREELEAAERRMNAARLALLDDIDLPNQTCKEMVVELSESMEDYMRLIRERLKGS